MEEEKTGEGQGSSSTKQTREETEGGDAAAAQIPSEDSE